MWSVVTYFKTMPGKRIIPLAYVLLFIVALLVSGQAYPQVIHAGLKGGFNMSWTRSDDAKFRKEYKVSPVPGFNGGAVFSFKMKERYFLHTEILYTTKGRIVEGELDLRDEVTYKYIEIPLIYKIHFKGSLKMKNMKQFKWYAGIGPNFSYWLGGKGSITHFEIKDHNVPEIKYELRFGERPSEYEGKSAFVFVQQPRRLQLGINFGGGILVEPINNRKIMVDLRFELGHSWLGESADYIFPESYSDNLEARNLGLRLSLMYLFETNLNKKVRNKGKSNLDSKGNVIKKKR